MKRPHFLALTLLIFAALVSNSADFLFRQSYYEVWDSAANSLSVLRAKHFAQLYGPYSRWGFHHPGPTLFYVQALGEWVFHDVLRWVKTPFPGQTLAHALLMCGFFVAALRTVARWLPEGRARWWFLCGALALAVGHFASMERIPSYDVLRGPSAFLSMWSAHALVLPFLCLLAAGASVAAGRGRDLPLLGLASGYLLQLHVAEPMFVCPVFALTYTALAWQTHRAPDAPSGWWARGGRFVGAPWRAFPREHATAALILLFFALPFLIDFCRGADSNVALILRHLREPHTQQTFERAWFYFLMFGAYTAYNPLDNEFAAYDRAGMLAFLRAHAGLYVCWAAVAVLAGWALVARWREGRDASDGTRFCAWAAGFLGVIVALTLRWNTRQDDQMFYFNSWFTFAIYYFAGLLALAVTCARLPTRMHRVEKLLGAGMVVILTNWYAPQLRLTDPSPGATAAMHADILRLEANSRAAWGSGGVEALPTRLFHFEYVTSPVAVAAALQLARDGLPIATENRWHAYFGDARAWSNLPTEVTRRGPLQAWRFAHSINHPPDPSAAGEHVTMTPYLRAFFLAADDIQARYSDPPIDPAQPGGAAVRFGPGGDAKRYGVGGWYTSDDGQSWIDDPRALLAFRPVPVPDAPGGEVEVTLDGLFSVLKPADRPDRQRLRVFYDGQPLGEEAVLTRDGETLTYRLPAARWNGPAATPAEQHHARLLIELPDAVAAPAPNALGARQERPPIGTGLREVRFRWIAP